MQLAIRNRTMVLIRTAFFAGGNGGLGRHPEEGRYIHFILAACFMELLNLSTDK